MPHEIPVIIQPRTHPTVIEPMQELGGKEYVVSMEEVTVSIIVIDIVLCIHVPEQGPGMNDRPALDIVFAEQRIEIEIEPAFIAVVPDDDRGVIDILFDHFFHEPATHFGIIGMMPSGQLVEHEYAQRVANIQKMIVGRIM